MLATRSIASRSLLRFAGLPRLPKQFCRMSSSGEYTYKYPRPGLTVDAAIVAPPRQQGEPAHLLLIKRGGFVDQDEPLQHAAERELKEETSLDAKDLLFTQVGAFGDPGRDPRGWSVSVAFAAVVPSIDASTKAGDDASDAQWFPLDKLPKMAFDHKLVVRETFQHLAQRQELQKQDTFIASLREGAESLAGPWEPPKE